MFRKLKIELQRQLEMKLEQTNELKSLIAKNMSEIDKLNQEEEELKTRCKQIYMLKVYMYIFVPTIL